MVEHHISGQLKVAPEHIADPVLMRMGKPENSVYERFVRRYKKLNEQMGKKQFVVPYLMSSHPGSTMKEAVALAEYLRDIGYMPEQVQDFYPTPSTMSTVMYYTGIDPRDMKPVYVVKNPHEKAMQRALIQYRNPANYDLVHEALIKAGREDLIGFDKKCLIRPRRNASFHTNKGGHHTHSTKSNVYVKHANKGSDNPKRGGKSDGAKKKKTIRNVHKKKKK